MRELIIAFILVMAAWTVATADEAKKQTNAKQDQFEDFYEDAATVNLKSQDGTPMIHYAYIRYTASESAAPAPTVKLIPASRYKLRTPHTIRKQN